MVITKHIRSEFHTASLILFAILIVFSGCAKKELKSQVSYLQEEVDGLESEVQGLEKENKSLQGRIKNIKSLEKELAIMKAKMDSVSQLPGALYSKAHSYYEQEQYNDCMTLLILLSEKYPDWDKSKVEKKYDVAFKKQKEYEKEQARQKKKEERKQKRESQMVDAIKNNVESVYDSKTNKTYYKTLRTTICKVEHTISFGIELYMVVDKNNKKVFRIRSTYIDKSGSDYHDPQWMNYNEIELLSDNNKRIIIKVNETEKKFVESRFINQETSDDIIETDQILNFHNANRVRVYFKGKYLYEFDMTYDQFNAFREILANYDYI
jgi:cell division protein FtsB